MFAWKRTIGLFQKKTGRSKGTMSGSVHPAQLPEEALHLHTTLPFPSHHRHRRLPTQYRLGTVSDPTVPKPGAPRRGALLGSLALGLQVPPQRQALLAGVAGSLLGSTLILRVWGMGGEWGGFTSFLLEGGMKEKVSGSGGGRVSQKGFPSTVKVKVPEVGGMGAEACKWMQMDDIYLDFHGFSNCTKVRLFIH